MAYIPPPVQPDFEKLRYIISSSPAAVKDRPLVQVLYGLLDRLKQFQTITVGDISELNDLVEAISVTIGNLTSDLSDASFITADDETSNFPSSIQLLPGDGVDFVDSANTRTINADLPVGTIYETWINVNPNALLGYGTWLLFATGVGIPGGDITYTLY